jgi:hypothetical protein
MSNNPTRMAMSVFDNRPDFGGLGNLGQSNRSMLKNSSLLNDANLMAKGMGAVGNAQGSKLMADAQISAANEQADATRSAGMWDMIGSIGGGLLGGIGKMGGGPTTGTASSAGSTINPMDGLSYQQNVNNSFSFLTPRDMTKYPLK